MAQIFTADEDTYAQMTYSRYQPGVGEFIQQQMDRAAGMLNRTGQALFQNAQMVFQNSLENPAIRIAQAAMRQIQSLWGTNNIQYLSECWQIQNAPPIMIPFIMAHTPVRELYEQQRCDGYQGKYFDLQPGAKGEDNLHWRAMNSGMINVDDETDSWQATTYSSSEDDLIGVQLSFDDQVDLKDTNQCVDAYMSQGRDATNVWDSDLG